MLKILKSSIDIQSKEIDKFEQEEVNPENGGELQPRKIILQFLESREDAFVDYDSIVSECSRQGISREDAEDAIEYLRETSGEIIEPKFGFYKLI